MSELPDTEAKEYQQVVEQKSKREEALQKHFGALSVAAAYTSIEAYCDDNIQREIALAWLHPEHKKEVKNLIGNDLSKKERRALVQRSVTKVALELKWHPQMVKYRHLFPVEE